MVNYCKQHGGYVLEKEWTRAKDTYHFKCGNPDHPIFETTADALYSGEHWCPYCSGRAGDFETELAEICSVYLQSYISPESLQSIPVTKKNGIVDDMSGNVAMSKEERLLYKEALRMKNRTRFSRKNINEYVVSLLEGKEKMSVEEIPIESKRDLIRIIYISIYAGNRANNYEIKRTNKRVKRLGYEFPLFDIIKR